MATRSRSVLYAVLLLLLVAAALASYPEPNEPYKKSATRETKQWQKKPTKNEKVEACPCQGGKRTERADSDYSREETWSRDEPSSSKSKRGGDDAIRNGGRREQTPRGDVFKSKQTNNNAQREQQPTRKSKRQDPREAYSTSSSSSSSSSEWTSSDSDEEMSQFPQCQRYMYDPYKQAKCERKAREELFQGNTQANMRQSAAATNTQSEDINGKYPQCQKYEFDELKLAKCVQKAQLNEIKYQSYSQIHQYSNTPLKSSQSCSQCDRCSKNDPCPSAKYSNGQYKSSQCERKSNSAPFVNSPSDGMSSETIEFPQCQKYAYNFDKLMQCEERARLQSESSAEGQAQVSKYPHCQRFAFDPLKLSKCEYKADVMAEIKSVAADAAASGETQLHFPHCQRFAYDPFKLAKCESKAQNMAHILQNTLGQDGEEQPINPQCQQFAYDPYKLAKCEFKIKKYASYTNNYL